LEFHTARRENIEKEEAKGEKSCQSRNGTKQQVFRESRSDFEENESEKKKSGKIKKKPPQRFLS